MKIKLLTLSLVLGLTFCAKAQTNVSLYQIQYSAVDTPYVVPNSAYNGQIVTTGGIVTGVPTSGDEYFIQTSNATKWAAVAVYDGTHVKSVAVGDSIVLTATVTEYYNETELASVTSLTVISSGNQALTPPTVIAFDSIQRREYQGMLVKVKDASCVRFNTSAVWYVFSDSTTLNSVTCEDTIDNNLMTTQSYINGDQYDITGCIHFEYANWIEPRSAADIQLISTAGIENIQNNFSDVNIFPNPNQGMFTATVNAAVSNKNTQVILSDITGRIIYKEQREITAGTNSIPVNISNLAKGTYFLQISNTDYSTVKKVIVQ